MLEDFTRQLAEGRDLTADQVGQAVRLITNELVTAETKAGFLTALAEKGETIDEISAFASELRDRSVTPPLDEETRKREILDVCGTGGDHQNTFNISTTVGLLTAAAGVTVAKHGNRAITSKSGSADVLQALGIPIELSPEEVAAALRDCRFAFLFAPLFHPAFRHIAPARKLCGERGQRTIFNFLGPLLNPAHPSAQLIGVPRPDLVEPMARVLQSLGVRRGMVVCGAVPNDGFMDELSTLGENTIAEFYQDRGFHTSVLSPGDFPIQKAGLGDLRGGDSRENAETLRAVLGGRDKGPRRDAVQLNAAAALFVAGRCSSMVEGWETAGGLMDSGEPAGFVESLASPEPAA